MKASGIDEMVSLLVASLFFSMWQSCVCRGGEIAMRQTHRAFNRKPETMQQQPVIGGQMNKSPP